MKIVYLDHAATTSLDPKVFLAMRPFLSRYFGNASEPHLLGQAARRAVEEARQKVADFLAAQPEEIVFTSGATESINLAHKGLIQALFSQERQKLHVIASQIEHKAVLETCRYLENFGLATISYLPVDRYGMVELEAVARAIRPETVLVSIMYVNNEVGTIQKVAEIGKLLKRLNKQRSVNSLRRIYFHTDATQAIQYLDCRVNHLAVDLLSFTGHKLYASKGGGVLYVRRGTCLVRQLSGGGQERNLRAGTENVPAIISLAKALELVKASRESNFKKLSQLQKELIKKILVIPGTHLTGHPKKRAPHIVSLVVEGVEGEALVLLLSGKKVMASTGSACTSANLTPSHVLTAMGVSPELAHGSLRLSLGKDNTSLEVNYLGQVLPELIKRLRAMAPT